MPSNPELQWHDKGECYKEFYVGPTPLHIYINSITHYALKPINPQIFCSWLPEDDDKDKKDDHQRNNNSYRF